MTRKRIVITYPFSIGIPGGGTKGCIQIARHLHAQGADVTILSVSSDGARGGLERAALPDAHGAVEKEKLREAGVPVLTVDRHPLHYSLDGLNVRRTLRTLLKHERLDAVIGFHHELLLSFTFLKANKVTTGMITAAPDYRHFLGRSPLTRRLRKRIIHACLERADILFTPSDYIRGDILANRKIDPNKAKIVPWGVAKRFFETVPQPPASPFQILFFGWWVQPKGVFDLLRALRPLAGKSWLLNVAGWGDEERVREAARECGIEDKLRILGRLDHNRLPIELARSNLAVLPSYIESFGLAVAEAQASAVPVLAYEVGSVPEILLNESTGWMVPPGDIAGLTAKIEGAIDDPQAAHWKGLQGRARVHQNFTWTRTAARILQELA